MGAKKIILGSIAAVLAILVLAFSGMIIEDVGGNDILVVKDVGSGNIRIYTEPGWYLQAAGQVTHFPKSFQFDFIKPPEGSKEPDESIKARFNDNGHGNISGAVRIDFTLDKELLKQIYVRYQTFESVKHDLIRRLLENTVYMAGPLMSSTESAASKRTLLRAYIEDQAQNGIYKTQTKDVKTKDPITGAEKTVTAVDLMADPKAPNGIARQEESPLRQLGFRVSNLSIREIWYEKAVNDQIAAQQKLIMDVQIAMAEAKKAEQRALTVAKEGEANAAKAKWEQETVKAQQVTLAEQKRDVAQLEMKAAEFNKQKNILEGQGEAERRRLIMESDGALTQKLATYEKVMGYAFSEFSKQKWTPEIQMGAGGSPAGQGAMDFINLLTVKAAKDLGLDMTMKGKK